MASSSSPTEPSSSRCVFLGVDVGTGSARAGLFDEKGKLLGSSSSPIQIWKDGAHVEVFQITSRWLWKLKELKEKWSGFVYYYCVFANEVSLRYCASENASGLSGYEQSQISGYGACEAVIYTKVSGIARVSCQILVSPSVNQSESCVCFIFHQRTCLSFMLILQMGRNGFKFPVNSLLFSWLCVIAFHFQYFYNVDPSFCSKQQSSTDIWLAVCAAVKAACSQAKVAPPEVKGLGFAATCSLVAVDSDSSPVSVSWSGDSRRNVIVWMDHRAVEQAERINSCKSPVLEYCGGAVSPEMEPPKLLWVKENLQESWSMVFRWMDLSDWLSYRATGDDARSLCTTVCKWTYLGHAHMQHINDKDSRDMEACGWDDDFWEEIGLGDLVEGHHAKIGRSVAFPGHPLGSGLTSTAAKELGLVPGIPVGTSLIDAHAGGVGVIESVPLSEAEEHEKEAICNRMVLVCGTSTCHMAVSRRKLFIPGVWGPFWSAMVPEYWLTEGGQSATGALLDHIIENHAASPRLANRAASQKISVFELLNKLLETMMIEQNRSFVAAMTEDLHVLPDFHGNRSPIADPKSKGVIYGLTLDTSDKQLALLYLATVQGIAYGTRHIVEHCNAHGHKINTLLACGGLSKNPIFIQEHADIIGCPIILPRESEPVLLGAAILGAVASRKYHSLHEAMKALNAAGQVIHPSNDPKVKKYHDAKYKIFRGLYEQQLSNRSMMAQALA